MNKKNMIAISPLTTKQAQDLGMLLLGRVARSVNNRVNSFIDINELPKIEPKEIIRRAVQNFSKSIIEDATSELIPKAELTADEIQLCEKVENELPDIFKNQNGSLEEAKLIQLLKLILNKKAKSEPFAPLLFSLRNHFTNLCLLTLDTTKLRPKDFSLEAFQEPYINPSEDDGETKSHRAQAHITLLKLPLTTKINIEQFDAIIKDTLNQSEINLAALKEKLQICNFQDILGTPENASPYLEKEIKKNPFLQIPIEYNGLVNHIREVAQALSQRNKNKQISFALEYVDHVLKSYYEGKVSIQETAKKLCLIEKITSDLMKDFSAQQEEWFDKYWEIQNLSSDELDSQN